MANAADYLRLDTTQLLTTYKLRTRSIDTRTFVATNIASNYTLTVSITPNLEFVTVTPSAFTLSPNASQIVSVTYDTTQLEVLQAGTLEGALSMTVSAAPIVIPAIPTPPTAPPLPEAPVQIVSRIQITPTNFTLSQIGETNQFTAILYVGDVPTPATFAWSLENDLAGAFVLDSTSGVIKAMKNGVNKATVKARLLTPVEYIGTEGLAIIGTNIPVIVPVGGDPVPTTGNLTVIVNGMSRNIGANVTISGINQSITDTTTFNNIPAGNYTITPNVVTSGNVNYNPTGGGEIYVAPGQNAEVVIQYTKQLPPDQNTIQIVDLLDSVGNILQQGATVNVGDRITVIANTYRNGKTSNLGDVQFTMNNTQEGVQTVQGKASGVYRATFTVTQPGVVNVTAYNQLGGSVTGQVNSRIVSQYTIKLNTPGQLILGQCSPITAVVLQDGVETNIPVQIDISGPGIISNDPCGVTQPVPTLRGGGGRIIDTGINAGSSTVDGFGGATSGGGFNQVAFIDQGINAI